MHRFIYVLVLFFMPVNLVRAQSNLKKLNRLWKKEVNNKTILNKVSTRYIDPCMIKYSSAQVFDIRRPEKDLEEFIKMYGKIKNIKSLNSVTDEAGNILDVGIVKSKNCEHLVYLAAWRKKNGAYKLEVHSIEKGKSAIEKYDETIDRVRELWVDFSNSHQPSKVLKLTYSDSATYFNNGEVYSGQKEILSKYAYMSKPNWKINLFPQEVIQINERLAYEIGKYKSSGEGQYILLWKKVEGEWKIDFDFNF